MGVRVVGIEGVEEGNQQALCDRDCVVTYRMVAMLTAIVRRKRKKVDAPFPSIENPM